MNGANEVKIIKRYQNRKLYDTHQSCYVTLDEISQMIKAGDQIRVIDNRTKNDITPTTLTQLLYETEKRSANSVPVEMLKQIIKDGDGSFSGYIRAKLASELAMFETSEPVVIANPETPVEINPAALNVTANETVLSN